MRKTIAVVGTLDTKGREFEFLKDQIVARGHKPLVIDVGVLGPPKFQPDITRDEVARAGGSEIADLVSNNDRGQAVTVMAKGAGVMVKELYEKGSIDGIISLGGSAGTTIGTAAMRLLPAGFPKVMVSTLASGNTRPYVGTKDVTMMYSIVDIAGINRVSRRVLANAAGAVCGMVEMEIPPAEDRPLVGATMFGVTTPCVTRVSKILEENGYEVLVFHATGTGGQAMEGLIEDGFIAGVADITTTEWVDEVCGGVLSAGPTRLEAAARKGIPQVVVPGALDMCNFGPMDTVPERYRHRNLYVHNPTVTLMRTVPQEASKIGEIIGGKVSASTGPVVVMLPLRGVSAIDAPGKPFYDPDSNSALFDALRRSVKPPAELVELDLHINDPEFADQVASTLLRLLKEWRLRENDAK